MYSSCVYCFPECVSCILFGFIRWLMKLTKIYHRIVFFHSSYLMHVCCRLFKLILMELEWLNFWVSIWMLFISFSLNLIIHKLILKSFKATGFHNFVKSGLQHKNLITESEDSCFQHKWHHKTFLNRHTNSGFFYK